MSLDYLSNETVASDHCLKFSKSVANVVLYLKVILGSSGVLLSVCPIALIGLSRIYKRFVHQLVMYLMAVNIAQALCQVIELIPVEVAQEERMTIRNGTGWKEVCALLGYLDIVTAWMRNLVIIWIMLYMLTLSWRLHRLQSSQQATPPSNNNSHTCEIIGVLLLVFSLFFSAGFPLLYKDSE